MAVYESDWYVSVRRVDRVHLYPIIVIFLLSIRIRRFTFAHHQIHDTRKGIIYSRSCKSTSYYYYSLVSRLAGSHCLRQSNVEDNIMIENPRCPLLITSPQIYRTRQFHLIQPIISSDIPVPTVWHNDALTYSLLNSGKHQSSTSIISHQVS